MNITVASEVEAELGRLFAAKTHRLAVAVTGAGAGLQSILWNVPGASSTLVAGIFPYHRQEIDRFAGPVLKYLSHSCAQQLATSAFLQAQESVVRDSLNIEAVGLGASAAMQTTRVRKGADEVYIAVRTTNQLWTAHVIFHDMRLSRSEQGTLVDHVCLHALFHVLKLQPVPLPGVKNLGWTSQNFVHQDTDTLVVKPLEVTPAVSESPLVFLDEGGEQVTLEPASVALMPGNFNPFHFGHDQCARTVTLMTGKPVVFGLTVRNAEKGEDTESVNRVLQFRGRKAAIVRNASRFIDMATQYGFKTFVVGGDTPDRIMDPQYCGGTVEGVAKVLDEFRGLGVRFYVIPRYDAAVGGMKWTTAPDMVRDLFFPIPGRFDVSSKLLRELSEKK